MSGRARAVSASVIAALALVVCLSAAPPQIAPAASLAAPGQGAPAGDQTATQPAPVFRTGVEVVLVDVTVTGRDNLPLDDLTAADFTIEEEGVSYAAETAQLVRLDGKTRADGDSLDIRSPEHARAEAARDDVRVFAVFMDDYHLGREPNQLLPLRKALEAFFKTMLGPTDLVTVMNPITPLSAIEWTRDRAGLALQLRNYEGRADQYQARSALEEGQLRSRSVPRVRAQVTMSALHALVAHLGSLREGRKSVLFVSRGVPLRFLDASLDRELNDLIRTANRGNVVIHTLDPRGLAVMGDFMLGQLASDTGGRALLNANYFEDRLKAVVQDASAHYLVTYTPKHARGDGKFHKIRVDVKRKGARVLARRGYWDPSPDQMTAAPAGPPVAADVAQALERLSLQKTERLVRVWTGYGPSADGRTMVRVTWEPAETRDPPKVPVATVDVRAEAATGELLAEAMALESARRPSDASASRAGGGVEPSAGGVVGGRDTAVGQLALPPGPAVLKFVATDASGEVVDKWDRRIEIPEFGVQRPSLGTPQFTRAQSVADLRDLRRGAAGTPVVDRSFRQTDLVVVRIEVPHDVIARAGCSAELQTRLGQRLSVLAVSRVGERPQVQVELPLRNLALGQYVLRFTSDIEGRGATSQVAAFSVER